MAITLIGAVTIFQDNRLDSLDITPNDDDGLGYTALSVDQDSLTTNENEGPEPKPSPRSRCQIVYILGVEGTMHHGILPVVESLAARQIDPVSSTSFIVHSRSKALRYGLFASTGQRFGFHEPPPMDDPRLVKKVITAICPNDGRKHVVIEAASFPCRGKFRVSRGAASRAWSKMSPEEIAESELALDHPTNLFKFYDAYHPFADIKFIVLDRPFLETIASHRTWDDGPIGHSNIIRGFLILLSRFLNAHRMDHSSGEKVWTVVFVEKLSVKYRGLWYKRKDRRVAFEARKDMIRNVATFLGWPQLECKYCFNSWVESKTDHTKDFEPELLQKLTEHMESLQGIWPPDE
ncbi:hypothetical protein HJC23_009101 [Cyclotella cryptica]|uniref:Uncharacterized protein n=1 Tax=Cyclotella cryptica TaxID=29204 RepID=A0ABD3QZE3_9STRA